MIQNLIFTLNQKVVILIGIAQLFENIINFFGVKLCQLFDNFKGYIDFSLLNDLVDENENIKFYLPFDNFKTTPTFADIEEYLTYKKGVMNFIKARNTRIENYANK